MRAPPRKDIDVARSLRAGARWHPALEPPATLRPVLLLLMMAFLGRWVYLESHQRHLQTRLAAAEAQQSLLIGRNQELERTVARQHARLRQAANDLQALGLEMEAIEMQLDGLDAMTQRLRAEMELPASQGTWSGILPAQGGQGSRREGSAIDRDRVALVRRRLAAGLADLYSLELELRARRTTNVVGLTGPQPPAVREPANWPVRGDVTSSFGWRTFRGLPNFHTGIDIAVGYGTPVQATADGVVLGSGWQPGYGWSVLLQHEGGYNTLYGHLSQPLVSVGQGVRQGDVLGLSGSSGTSTGPHLHYEIWRDGLLLDPRPFMDGTAHQ